MSLDKEQAYLLYVEHKMPATEVATIIGVHVKTIRRWCKEGNWKEFKASDMLADIKLKRFYYQQTDQIIETAKREGRTLKPDEALALTRILTASEKTGKRDPTRLYIAALRDFYTFLAKRDIGFAKIMADYGIEFMRYALAGYPDECETVESKPYTPYKDGEPTPYTKRTKNLYKGYKKGLRHYPNKGIWNDGEGLDLSEYKGLTNSNTD